MPCMRLNGPTDFDGFRRAARALLAADEAPDAVQWAVADALEPALAFEAEAAAAIADGAALKVPAALVELMRSAALHRDARRHALMYRLLWRLKHEPSLRDDPLDADRVALEHLARAVRRDIHKMRAFVRFRTVAADDLHVAWFEPEHHIVLANAPFFTRRFTQMRWAILTPDLCIAWDGHALATRPGARRQDAPPPDAGERLWLTYYEHIFNPARLKLDMMRKEMPRRYWRNLPEATLIQPLAAAAATRSGRMVEQPPTETAKRRPASAGPERGVPVGPPGAPPESLTDLALRLDRCRECPIGEPATQAVPGEGPLAPQVMFVGEQPGDVEDLRGRPFVGPAGQLFTRAMERLAWPRETVYVTNAVKHFKYELRGKRRLHKTPGQREVAACHHWLESEIAMVQPKALVALGSTASRALMGRAVAVTKERGQWLVRPDGRRVLVTLHPSALLHLPDDERDAAFERWLEDLALARERA